MKKAVPYLITLILLLVMGGVFLKLYYDHYMYTDERVDLNAYYGVQDEDDFPVIYENLVSEMHARRFDGECYMDLDTVLSLLNDRFYYGTQDGTLIYCLPEEMFIAKLGEKSCRSAYAVGDGADGHGQGQHEYADPGRREVADHCSCGGRDRRTGS